MRLILGWVRQEPALKAVSLLIALVLWAWHASETNPDEARRFVRTVKVDNLARDLTVVNPPPTVEVTLYGPRQTLDELQARDQVQPVVDLRGIEHPAWRSEPIVVSVPDNVQVRKVNPERWDAEIDQLETGVRPVRAELGGTAPPTGYLYEPPELGTQTAQVRGARKQVSRVVYAAAQVDLSRRVAPFTGLARLRPLDSTGQEVPGVECNPTEVTVSVRIARIQDTHQMRVVVPLDNHPASGYVLRGYEVTPGSVTVKGTAAGLARLGEALATPPVDLAGKTASFEQQVALAPPSGVVAEPAAVRVRVRIEPEVKGTR